MRKLQTRQPAQITVFVSMALVVILTLLCTSLESARVSVLRYYIRTAAESSVFSVFSEYHRELLDRYHLFFLEDDGSLEQSAREYLTYYEQPSKELMVGGMHFYPFETDELWMEESVYALDQGASPVEDEIMEYMKFGMVETLVDQVKDKLQMGQQCQEMMDAVDQITASAGDVLDLENQYVMLKETAEDLQFAANEAVDAYQELKPLIRAKSDLEQRVEALEKESDEGDEEIAASLRTELRKARKELSEVCKRLDQAAGQVRGKEKTMGELTRTSDSCLEQIQQSTERLMVQLEPPLSKLEQLKPQLSDEFLQAANQQTEAVEAYTKDNGTRKALAIKIGDHVEELKDFLDRQPEIEKILQMEPGDAETLLDKRGEYVSFHTELAGAKELQEAEEPMCSDLLEQIKGLKEKGILSLVIGGGESLSSRQIESKGLPSEQLGQSGLSEQTGSLSEVVSGGGRERDSLWDMISGVTGDLYENLCLSEYALKTMPSYVDRGTDSNGKEKDSFYDLEYILGKSRADQENLSQVMEKLLLIREGMNFIYLLGDQTKSAEAQTLAMALTGVLGLTPLAGLMKLMILAAWAFAESVMDVRALADGGRVPFLKQSGDWKTTLEQAPAMIGSGQSGSAAGGSLSGENGKKGMRYQDYLRLLLCLTSKEKKLYRSMDMIQWNIQREESGFYLRNCLYQTSFHMKVRAEQLFVTLPLIGVRTGADGAYHFETAEERSYGEEFSQPEGES